jgi:hypothetical protein
MWRAIAIVGMSALAAVAFAQLPMSSARLRPLVEVVPITAPLSPPLNLGGATLGMALQLAGPSLPTSPQPSIQPSSAPPQPPQQASIVERRLERDSGWILQTLLRTLDRHPIIAKQPHSR